MDAPPVTKPVADAGRNAVRQPVTGGQASRFPIGATADLGGVAIAHTVVVTW